jgi:hypothetical protein
LAEQAAQGERRLGRKVFGVILETSIGQAGCRAQWHMQRVTTKYTK